MRSSVRVIQAKVTGVSTLIIAQEQRLAVDEKVRRTRLEIGLPEPLHRSSKPMSALHCPGGLFGRYVRSVQRPIVSLEALVYREVPSGRGSNNTAPFSRENARTGNFPLPTRYPR